MGKRIVVLNGSPRKGGNTACLVDAFTEGAVGAGHGVDRFDLQWMDIRPWIGCYGGGADPASPCVQKDDMDPVYAACLAADVIVLASPLYYWMVSGQLKTALDRLFAIVESDPEYRAPKRECALLMAAEGPDEFGEVSHWYENIARYLGWQSRGSVLVGNVRDVGDIHGREELCDAKALGAAL